MNKFSRLMFKADQSIRRKKRRCTVCNDTDAPWLWKLQTIGGQINDAYMCHWHNTVAQMERMGGPVGRIDSNVD